MDKDVGNYFYQIAFETQVYNGVYWVPVNSLGKTGYTSADILEICKMPLENKKVKLAIYMRQYNYSKYRDLRVFLITKIFT